MVIMRRIVLQLNEEMDGRSLAVTARLRLRLRTCIGPFPPLLVAIWQLLSHACLFIKDSAKTLL